jgi:hypothetical protein
MGRRRIHLTGDSVEVDGKPRIRSYGVNHLNKLRKDILRKNKEEMLRKIKNIILHG